MILESGGSFQCSECGKSFSVKGQCRRHVQNVHSFHQKVLCPVCHRYMKNSTTLKSHLRGTHGVYQKWMLWSKTEIRSKWINSIISWYVHRWGILHWKSWQEICFINDNGTKALAECRQCSLYFHPSVKNPMVNLLRLLHIFLLSCLNKK